MAGPQFVKPRGVTKVRPPRRFTLDQANRSLPLVKRIVADIVRSHEAVTEHQAALEHANGKEQPIIQDRLHVSLENLQDYVDELLDVGCELKDYRLGLIDFVGRHKGRDVHLCWKLGEDQIGFWHELQTGFAGRQPVSILDESEPK